MEKMRESESHHNLPDFNRLSSIVAVIFMAYALAQFVDLPERTFRIQLPGLFLTPRIGTSTVASFIVAGLTITGMQWLLQDHPAITNKKTFEHWLLPGLTAWVIELPLSQLPLSPFWWIGFTVGGSLMIAVILAEYIAVDPDDARYTPAASLLTILSFALFLVLVASLRFSQTRLFFILPILGVASFLVSLRTLHLRLHGYWALLQSLLVTLIILQIAAALHYWPISPISFGLALLGPAYSLTDFFYNLTEGEPFWQAVVEPGILLIIFWGFAIWMN